MVLLNRVGLVLIRVDSGCTRVDSCWLVSDSCLTRVDSFWLVLDSCWFVLTRVGLVLIRVDSRWTRVASCWTRVDSCWFVLIRVDLCWHSCIKIDLILLKPEYIKNETRESRCSVSILKYLLKLPGKHLCHRLFFNEVTRYSSLQLNEKRYDYN